MHRYARFAQIIVTCCVLAGLSACAPRRLRADYQGFEGAYAETSNREMLLNLARLSQHDPTYFFKLGQIATSYRMQAGIGGSTSYSTQGGNGHSVTTGGVTPSLNYETDPAFTFIPVNDSTTAQLLLKPIPAELFYALYQQGWRADQLFRLMVDRIEYRLPGKSQSWQIIRNSPTDPDYATFLRVSALVYELQRRGYLLLEGRREFVPVSGPITKAPSLQDDLAARAKNLVLREHNKQWVLGQENIIPLFELNPKSLTKQDRAQILSDMPELGRGGLRGATALERTLVILQNGFTIQDNPASGEPATNGKNAPVQHGHRSGRPIAAHLVMRSLIGMMAAAAQEQEGFDRLVHANPVVPYSNHLRFTDVVPQSERHPVLRLKWGPRANILPPLVEVTYGKENYMVTDASEPATLGPASEYSWNRDVFRLICLLTAQVTVDISKFPLPEILQLHTN